MYMNKYKTLFKKNTFWKRARERERERERERNFCGLVRMYFFVQINFHKNNKNCFLYTYNVFKIYNIQILTRDICYTFLSQIKIRSKGSARVTQIKKVECIGERKIKVVPSRSVGRFPHHRILHSLPMILPSFWISLPPCDCTIHSSVLPPLCWFLCWVFHYRL